MLLKGLSQSKWSLVERDFYNWLNSLNEDHWLPTGDWHKSGRLTSVFSHLDHQGVDLVHWSSERCTPFALRTTPQLFLRIERRVVTDRSERQLQSELTKWRAGSYLPKMMIWLKPGTDSHTAYWFSVADLFRLVELGHYTDQVVTDRGIKTEIGIADSHATLARFDEADLLPIALKVVQIPVGTQAQVPTYNHKLDQFRSQQAGTFWIGEQRCLLQMTKIGITCKKY